MPSLEICSFNLPWPASAANHTHITFTKSLQYHIAFLPPWYSCLQIKWSVCEMMVWLCFWGIRTATTWLQRLRRFEPLIIEFTLSIQFWEFRMSGPFILSLQAPYIYLSCSWPVTFSDVDKASQDAAPHNEDFDCLWFVLYWTYT